MSVGCLIYDADCATIRCCLLERGQKVGCKDNMSHVVLRYHIVVQLILSILLLLHQLTRAI